MRNLLVDPDPACRSIIACWLDEFFGRAGLEHASSGAEAKAIDERCPERTQMRKSLMTGAAESTSSAC